MNEYFNLAFYYDYEKQYDKALECFFQISVVG